MKPHIQQFELRHVGLELNLAGETGIDPARVMLDRQREAGRLEAAREYERKMQRTLAECPGFCGAEAPAGPESQGKVMVEPGRALEARVWLHRRFLVADDVELSTEAGLVFRLLPGKRKSSCRAKAVQRIFKAIEQFEFAL